MNHDITHDVLRWICHIFTQLMTLTDLGEANTLSDEGKQTFVEFGENEWFNRMNNYLSKGLWELYRKQWYFRIFCYHVFIFVLAAQPTTELYHHSSAYFLLYQHRHRGKKIGIPIYQTCMHIVEVGVYWVITVFEGGGGGPRYIYTVITLKYC